MSSITYKNLYQLVVEEINKRVGFNTNSQYQNQTTRTLLSPVSGDGRSDASTAEIVTAIQDLLAQALPSIITEGLIVTATTPISTKVNISLGKGSVGGMLYTLENDATIEIPFNNTNSVFYLVLYKNRILIESTYNSNRLTVAKIIIPKPGITNLVQDDKDGSWNAYIVNFREQKLYGYNDKFEEDSIELLRDNIGKILADNLIGNIKLNEDLKILNTAGTLELDSNSMKLYDLSENLLAKFNQNGVYFYDSNGIELGRFTNIDARVGNILITKNSIESDDFISGYNGRGFQIRDDGSAQFLNVLVRGELQSAIFKQDEIQVSSGDVVVSKGTILDEDLNTVDTTIKVKEGVFDNGDILRLKNSTQSEYLKVISGGGTTTLVVTRDFDGTGNNSWVKGDVILLISDRISLVSSGDSSANLPYIEIVTRNSANTYNDETTKTRIGNLNGLGFAGRYGIYNVGDFIVGDVATDNYIYYNSTTGILTITGDIILGGAATPPGDVLSFTVSQYGDKLIFNLLPVLEVDLAGYELRVGLTWDTGSFIDFFVNTRYELPFFLLGPQLYWIKARDFAGNYSVNANYAYINVLYRPGITTIAAYSIQADWNTSQKTFITENIQEHWKNLYNANYNSICWTGKTNDRWDSVSLDWLAAEEGQYEYDFPLELGYHWVETYPYNWGFEGYFSHMIGVGYLTEEGYKYWMEQAESLDNITWTDYHLYTLGQIYTRWTKIKATSIIATGYEAIDFYWSRSYADGKEFSLHDEDVDIAVAGTNITFTKAFINKPNFIVTAIKASTPLVVEIDPDNITITGVTGIKLRNPETTAYEIGKINYVATGY